MSDVLSGITQLLFGGKTSGGAVGCGGRGRSSVRNTNDAEVQIPDGRPWDAPLPPVSDAAAPDAGLPGEILPAEILRTGERGYLLRGIVLTPDGVLEPGDVLFVDNEIKCVAADCTGDDDAAAATWIDTHGIISPGLIDSHNHLAYNFLPEWVPSPPRFFNNRYEWSDDPGYEAHIAPYADHRSSNDYFCPAAKWGELRSLIHGTTTMQDHPSASGSCINWGIRNANEYHGLGYDYMDQNIASVRDYNDAAADSVLTRFNRSEDPITRKHEHMAEGVSGSHIEEELDSYAGRDPRTNRHRGVSLLGPQSILIHCIPLTESQLVEVRDTGANIVWSPSSNMVLYGATANIQRILELGIPVGLGPDWTVSGEDEMLSEMRFALALAEKYPLVTPDRLWRMATSEGAAVLDLDGTRPGLEGRIGKLEAGYRADIAVFASAGSDPYRALINSRAQNVRLVFIDGQGFYGDENLQEVTRRNDYCESFDACGTAKFLCAQDSPSAPKRRNETYADIRGRLIDILAEYGRDDLLELADCSAD